MATLLEDIKKSSEWIVDAFKELGKNLDYSIESLKIVDDFFEEQTIGGVEKPGGLLEKDFGGKIFSIASYVGKVLIRNSEGSKWVTDDSDPEGGINIQVQFTDGGIVWPGQKVMKRFKNCAEDSLYGYAYLVTNKHQGKQQTAHFPDSSCATSYNKVYEV